jgi:hypothetical protein
MWSVGGGGGGLGERGEEGMLRKDGQDRGARHAW